MRYIAPPGSPGPQHPAGIAELRASTFDHDGWYRVARQGDFFAGVLDGGQSLTQALRALGS